MKLISGLAAVALAATTLTVASPASAAETAGDRAVAAGTTWLKSQLTDGIVVGTYEGYIYDDFGLSADVAFALDAVGGQDATVVQIADSVAPKVTGWYDSFGTVYTGSAAKAVALAQVAGKDATDFGGQNLQAVVEGNVATTGVIVGRVQNTGETTYPSNEPTDSLNVISQSWAARALAGQNSGLADEVMAFLLDQQCDDGSFRAGLTQDKAAAEQGCATGVVGEVDTTALAVLNILGAPDASVTAKGAAYLAASWLKSQQAADGSFIAGSLGSNSNTTGLAGWALAETGHDGAAGKAASWLRGLQVADLAPCATGLAAENGAVAYKASDLATARTAGGISVPAQDGFRRATAQALPALAYVPEGSDALGISAPVTAAENTTVTVTVTGLGAGEPACVSFGAQAKQVRGTGAAQNVTFQLPAGVATHTFRLATLGGTTTATTTATVTPTPVPQVGALTTTRVVKVGHHRFRVSVACEGAVVCAGRLTVRTARRVEMRSGKRVVTVAKREYSVAAGEEKRLVVRLTKAGRIVLADGKVKVKAVQKAPGAKRAVTTFWLKAAKG